jgi:hypothetical protein
MTMQDEATHGPKYDINIEGTIYPWDKPTITVPELRKLAGIPADQQMMEVDLKTNEERTLSEDAVIELQPGMGYAKKVRYQRG